jgi:aspartate/methionine/tyrosine aminotransferase
MFSIFFLPRKGNPTGQVSNRQELEVICKVRCLPILDPFIYSLLVLCTTLMTLSLSFFPFLQFCSDNGIVLLADEVYQRNVYAPDKEFLSAKKVALETSGCEHLQLISFHSTSKGLIGEYI